MNLREQVVVVVVVVAGGGGVARSEIYNRCFFSKFPLLSIKFPLLSIKFPLLSTKHWELFIFGVWSF